jgi:FemAB family protein
LIKTEFVQELAENAGLQIKFRFDVPSLWRETLLQAAYVPYIYTSSSIDFQHEIQRYRGGTWLDLSMIIELNGKSSAVWPLSLSTEENDNNLSSLGFAVHPPLFVSEVATVSEKRLTRKCLDFLYSLVSAAHVKNWKSTEFFRDRTGLGPWYEQAVMRGAKPQLKHELFINMRPDIEIIRNHFRKSFKPLVNKEIKGWSLDILDKPNPDLWEQFKLLHLAVAGRKTRSDLSWNIHLEDIGRQCGFLVYMLNEKGGMEAGGFFNNSRDEGMYAVAAYNRDLFDKPLGHIIQYKAIQELKNRGVRWHKLGLKPLISDHPKPSEKEINIGDFKQGFASHLLPIFNLDHVV